MGCRWIHPCRVSRVMKLVATPGTGPLCIIYYT
jgi:hypothetical protein